MKRRCVVLAAGLLWTSLCHGQYELELESANNDVRDRPSLQRGAKYFVDYCSGCHATKYVRYSQIAQMLSMTPDRLFEFLAQNGAGEFDYVDVSMQSEHARQWFGVEPPDLSLISRSHGADYVFTYLKSFYASPSAPRGVDNLVLPGTAMPHVLWELQGVQVPVYGTGEDGAFIEGFELLRPGNMTSEEFDGFVRDIANFLDLVGEPMQQERVAIGIRVIAFLLVFLLVSYLLQREIWKELA